MDSSRLPLLRRGSRDGDDALGSSGHRHNDCWLILDLQEDSARLEFLRRPQPAE